MTDRRRHSVYDRPNFLSQSQEDESEQWTTGPSSTP
jgi:hypothetical protein